MAKLTPIHIVHGKQLREVTGATTDDGDIAVLKKNGIPYIRDAAGKPRVLKEALLLIDRKPKTNESDKTQPNIPNVHRIN